MSKNVEHSHVGHRQRLKDKVRENGLRVLKDHEILELLLTYTIPRKDTNELAHNLLNEFRTLPKVINADYKKLLANKGVGEESALFFKVLSELILVYKEQVAKEENNFINNTSTAVTYFRQRFVVEGQEIMHIVCISKRGNILYSHTYRGETDAEIKVNIRHFSTLINQEGVCSVLVFHTHPNGDVKPTQEDLETTKRLLDCCNILCIKMVDHIILNETNHYSMKDNNDLDRLMAKNFEEIKGNSVEDDCLTKWLNAKYKK